MMYIEQAPLGGNLLKFLKNSASLNNGTATKEPNAVNGESSSIPNGNCQTSFLKKLEAVDKRNKVNESKDFKQAQESLAAKNEDDEEEEQYTLFEVIDEPDKADLEKSVKAEHEENLLNGFEIKIDRGSSSKNISTIKDGKPIEYSEASDSDSDGYEVQYIKVLTRKPKHKQKADFNFIIEPRKQIPPVPAAIPFYQFEEHKNKRLLNGISARQLANDLSHQSNKDRRAYNCFESVLEDRAFDGNQTRDSEQMGIDILGGIRQFFNWKPKTGGSNRNTETTETQSAKRKRRSENLSTEGHFKYRKVENNFPKVITHSLEDDTDFTAPYRVPILTTQRNQSNIPKLVSPIQQSFEMTQRGGAEPKSRRSWFRPPQTTNKTVRNTSYADIEFSDDDEDNTRRLQKSLDITSTFRRQPRVTNIPIFQEQPSVSSSASLKPPFTSSFAHEFVTPHTLFNIEPIRRPTYAEALRYDMPFGGGVGHMLNGHSISSNASSASGASTSRFGNVFGMTRLKPKAIGRSILVDEREKEDHAKYKQLLDTISRNNASCIQRSGNVSKKPRVSSKFSSPNITHRAPLSSTINIDEDEEDYNDVTITGVSHLKSPKPPKKRETISTVVIDDDDDDISEIIDLDKEQPKKKNIETIDLDAKENKRNDLPYVEPVNSFRDLLNTMPVMKDTWFTLFNSKYEEKRKLREAEVNKTLEIAEKLTAERRVAELELQERLQDFRIVDPDLLVVDDFAEPEIEEEPEFPELNAERQSRIKAAVYGPPDQVLIGKFNMNITRRDIQTLLGHNWLNDEVINFYMNLITERSEIKHESHGYPRVYAMNTFFLQRLQQNGHSGVKRWTRKVNIFEKDILPVPVHVGGVHWCMAIIHLKNRWIRYYDSMGSPNPNVLKLLEQYLKDESLDKRNQPFDTSGFVIESVRDVPRQMNGSDCGVFSCMFAEYVSRNKEITFSQQHMEYFRHKMILEIVQGELLL